MPRRLPALALSLLCLAGCRTYEQPSDEPEPPPFTFRVGPGDTLRVGVWGETIEATPATRMPAGLLPQNVWQQTSGGPLAIRKYHGLQAVEIPKGAEVFTCNLILDAGESLHFYGRYDLGETPADALDTLTAIRGGQLS